MTSVIIHSSFDIIDRMEAEVNRLETLVISAAGGQHGGRSAQSCVRRFLSGLNNIFIFSIVQITVSDLLDILH